MTGHRVGVDQQDRLALAGLEGRGQVGRDGRLADAALRVEDGDQRGAVAPGFVAGLTGGEHRTAAVVDGLTADAHRLDAPADRVGRVRPGEVFVARAVVLGGMALVVLGGDDGECGDRLTGPTERAVEGIVLVRIDLAVEDRHGDVPSAVEERLELERCIDTDRLEPGHGQLRADRVGLVWGQGDDDRVSGHG